MNTYFNITNSVVFYDNDRAEKFFACSFKKFHLHKQRC